MNNRNTVKKSYFFWKTVFVLVMLCLPVKVLGQDPVLKETIARMNKACPIRVDDITIQTGYRYESDYVMIDNTISVPMSKEEMEAVYGTQVFREELLKAYTQLNAIKSFTQKVINANAGIMITYTSKSHVTMTITFSPQEIRTGFYNEDHGIGDSSSVGDENTWHNLGVNYLLGTNGYPKDYNKAFYWEKKAAEEGVINAQVNLALCYELGWGTTKDIDSAIYWYKKAIDRGNDHASLNLGTMYTYTTKDYDAAIQCLEELANKGDADAQDILGTCYGFGKKMYQKALYWKTKAAEQGGAKHQSNLGIAYMKGNVGTIDYEKAIYWLKLASEKRNKNAMHNLPIAQYEQAELLRQNKEYDAAFILFKQAATNSNNPIPAAMRKLAACYRYGLGTNTSLSEEKFWMEEAVKYNDEIAMKIMGARY